jgi:hypothetical protein
MSLLTKIALFLGVLLVFGFVIWLACHYAYGEGQVDGTAAEKKLWDASNQKLASQEAAQRLQTQQQIAPIQPQVDTSLAVASSQLAPQPEVIVKYVKSTPSYAACTRPAAVEQLRTGDLSDLATLAAQSASAAPSSASSVPAPSH